MENGSFSFATYVMFIAKINLTSDFQTTGINNDIKFDVFFRAKRSLIKKEQKS
jgi:hypothetical protein